MKEKELQLVVKADAERAENIDPKLDQRDGLLCHRKLYEGLLKLSQNTEKVVEAGGNASQ